MKHKLIALMAAGAGVAAPPLWAQTVSTLDAVVVTANRIQEAKREISSNVTIIDSEDIKASTAATVADLVVQQGFNVVTTGDTSNVQIRGFGNLSMTNEYENTVLMLLNGRRTGIVNLALAGLANVERVEIIRGPSAVQYGSSAMGGVINIITKRGSEKPLVSLELGLGSDSLTREKLALSGAKNGFDFSLGATNYRRGDVTAKDGERWYHTGVKHNTAVNLDVGYTFNKNQRVGLSHYYGDVKSVLTGTGLRPYVTNTPGRSYQHHDKHSENTALSYTGNTPDKRFDWSASYAFGSYNQKFDYWAPPPPRYDNKLDTRFFNAQGGYNGSMFSVSAGLDHYKYEARPDSMTTNKWTMEDLGVYATGKLRLLNERLIFSAGLRHDSYTNKGNTLSSSKDSHTTGSVGVSYLPLDWLKLRANYAEGFKMPSAAQIAGGATAWSVTLPNSSLSPEKSKTYEIGADVHWRQVNASLTYFHSGWKNKILSQMVASGTYQNQNLDAATLAGLEGSVSADVGKMFQQAWTLKPYLGFTWLETRENRDATRIVPISPKTLPNTPEWMGNYGVDYAHPAYKIKSRIGANYYGSRYTQDWDTGRGWIKHRGGTVVNLSLEKQLADLNSLSGTLTLRTEINNLFDSANEMYWNYPGPGRNFYVGLRYDYR
ncbi:MAG: TonB-dependent receptor [Candidatus Accumulibacter sp.]|nr:TonB-dependent receptor [Accumulibacter sp.]